MHALAAAISIIVGLTTYTIAKLVQSRGKLSLKLTIFVLPLLTAVVCVALLQLNPYRQRHLAISALKNAGLNVRVRRPDIQGEWFRDRRSGLLLPYWLIRLCGEHSTSEASSVRGDLESFQTLDISRLRLVNLLEIQLNREGADPALSPQMIASLTQFRQLRSIELDLEKLTVDDMDGLMELEKLKGIKSIQICAPTGKIGRGVDLSVLPQNCSLILNGFELTTEQASQIKHLRSIDLTLKTVSADAIETLTTKGPGRLRISDCSFDSKAATAITKYSGDSLVLVNCKFPQEFTIEPGPLGRLYLGSTNVSKDCTIQWLKKSGAISFGTDQNLTAEELDSYRQIEGLQWISHQSPGGETIGLNLRSK